MSSELHPDGSVFTVDVRAGVKVGLGEPEPNDQSYDVAVVEFQDDGTPKDARQLPAAAECITRARKGNPNGAIVVLFIHGWHHGASWDIRDNTGDAHFRSFRDVLSSLTLREAERYFGHAAGRRVVGIYLGWNGDPESSWFRNTAWLKHLSFWDRYDTAKRFGEGDAIIETIRTIIDCTKAHMTLEGGASAPASPLTMVGHSMGALVLEYALLGLLKANDPVLQHNQQGEPKSCVEVRQGDKLVSFPDLMIALNSAADSEVAKQLIETLKQKEITKNVACDGIRYAAPLFVSMTSVADTDTRLVWRLAQGAFVRRRTDGHDRSLFTHAVEQAPGRVTCTPKNFQDLGQEWHCLRPPRPREAAMPEFEIDLPGRKRHGEQDRDGTCHVRYQIRPLDRQGEPRLAWIFQVPRELITEHNDIFNFRSNLMILALMQISGAVVSVAEQWRSSFEE